MSFVFLRHCRRVRELYTGRRRRPSIFSTDTVKIMFCKLVHFESVIASFNKFRQTLVLYYNVNLIACVLHYLTPMRLGLWQGSLRMQIFFVELHNKRWNMWSSFSRRRLWIKPGVFIRDITATLSWQYKELVTPIARMFWKYFWDIIVMEKKTKRPKQAKPRKQFRLIRSSFWFWFWSFWCFCSFRFDGFVLLLRVLAQGKREANKWIKFIRYGFSDGIPVTFYQDTSSYYAPCLLSV